MHKKRAIFIDMLQNPKDRMIGLKYINFIIFDPIMFAKANQMKVNLQTEVFAKRNNNTLTP